MSASQNPYFRSVRDARACCRSSKRRLPRNAGVLAAFMKCSYAGKSSSKTKCRGCRTRVHATKPMPGTPAVRSDKCTRARSRVMPCAFQCVNAHANVSGYCSRQTFSSTVDETRCRKIGTQFRRNGSPGKKERGWPVSSSTPKFTESNSTNTHNGDCFFLSLLCGSPPCGHM